MSEWKHVIAVEGEASLDKRLCIVESLTWETPMPVMGPPADDDAPWSYPIIGTVESIEREGRLIIGAGRWHGDPPTAVPGQGWCITVDNAQFDVEEVEGVMTLSQGRIRAVYVGTPIWPECAIEDSENTGGIVPPYITDRIPGHEDDQP